MTQFEMVYYRRVQNGSSIMAEFAIRIPKWDLTLYKLKLIQGKSGGTFISGPSEEYKDKAGERKFSRYWAFGKETDERFQKEVKRFVEEYNASKPEVETQRAKEEECPF